MGKVALRRMHANTIEQFVTFKTSVEPMGLVLLVVLCKRSFERQVHKMHR